MNEALYLSFLFSNYVGINANIAHHHLATAFIFFLFANYLYRTNFEIEHSIFSNIPFYANSLCDFKMLSLRHFPYLNFQSNQLILPPPPLFVSLNLIIG